MDWTALKELRELFLGESSALKENYWTKELLSLYDQTFAQRIGWKWDAVLAEMKAKGWSPPAHAVVVDWGCGTGVAAQKFLSYFPETKTVYFYDKNPHAIEFACEKNHGEKLPPHFPESPVVLLVSHVLNELSAVDLVNLVTLCKKAHALFWVEPGTHAGSRKLISMREALLKEGLTFLAPCPHQESCPMLASTNEKHWCHHFVPPPSQVFQSTFWSEFSTKMGIDLRSLPLSYLVATQEKIQRIDDKDRLIGKARIYKGYAEALLCKNSGNLEEEKILKRDHPEILKALKENPFSFFL